MVYVILVILGLAFGSFVNAFVWRWHNRKDWIKGQSECVHCHHKLVAVDLIPLLSWFMLRGKCRYCHKSISVQYPLVELLTAILFVLSYAFWPLGIHGAEIAVFAFWLVVLVGLVALAVYDIRWQLLPNKIVFSLFALAVVQALIRIAAADRPLNTFLNLFFGALVASGIFYILFQISKGRWIGGGDVKLGLLLGLLVATPGRSFLLIFLAALFGTIVSVPFMLAGRMEKSSRIPFGPFLILATIVVVLFGHAIVHWYQTAFLPPGIYD